MLIVFLEQLQICISFSQRTYCKWEKNISRTKLMQAELADIYLRGCIIPYTRNVLLQLEAPPGFEAYKLISSTASNILRQLLQSS